MPETDMPATNTRNSIRMYDYTIPKEDYSVAELRDLLNIHCTRWCFQLERGTGGNAYEHYQVRLSFKDKIRFSTLKAQRRKRIDKIKGHFKPTSNPTFYTGNEFYVTKEDTRIDGPWTDRDEHKVMTRQLKEFLEMPLRPWQKYLIEECTKYDSRKINIIYDKTGCCGKSILSEHLEYLGIAEEVPPFRLMDDIFQWVASRPTKKCYIVDMPRGMKKDRLGDFYSGIEVIKNGVAYDKRYTAKKKRFDRPRVFIFTNMLPVLKLMSKDRIEICTIQEDYSYTLSTE